MNGSREINEINRVIERFFIANPSVSSIPAKDLMPEFIKAEIFTKDHRNGLPIRNVLRELDENKNLALIPYVRTERKKVNTYWFFERRNR